MNAVPQFSLRWNNYVTHVTGAFNSLRLQNDLIDVTLCCEGRKIKAHKMLLSACSGYFKEIFRENPCKHPVIIFRNFKFDDLNAIINFMYHGEVNILQEQLESFLITAEVLEVKGLTDSVDDDDETRNAPQSDSGPIEIPTKKLKTTESEFGSTDEPINLAMGEFVAGHSFLPNTSSALNENGSVKVEEIETENQTFENESRPPVPMPTVLEDVQMDQSSNNIDDIMVDRNNANVSESDLAKFRCQLCPKGFKHPTSLTLHKDSHAGKTQCPVCHRSFSRSYDMRSHLQKIHQGKQLTIKEIRYKSSNEAITPKTFTHHM